MTAPARRAPVRVTLVERTCETCHRVGLDVWAASEDQGAICVAGVGCNTKARALRDITLTGVTLADVGRARRSLGMLARALRTRRGAP